MPNLSQETLFAFSHSRQKTEMKKEVGFSTSFLLLKEPGRGGISSIRNTYQGTLSCLQFS